MSGPSAAGEMWPGGPVELPVQVRLCGATYTCLPVSTGRLAYLVATTLSAVPMLLSSDERAAVHLRLADPHDPLDVDELEEASVLLASRLAGVRRGVSGWRAAVNICTALTLEWEQTGTHLMQMGVDLSWPLWRVAGYLYSAAVNDSGGEEGKRNSAAARLIAPLDWEPPWLARRLAGTRPVPVISRAKQVAANRAFYQQFTGKTLASR